MKWILLGSCLAAGSVAAATREGPSPTVGREEVINEDLHIEGGQVQVLGAVHGNVYASGGSVELSGPIDGDVVVAAGTISISGPVSGSVWAAGGQVLLDGAIGEDVL